MRVTLLGLALLGLAAPAWAQDDPFRDDDDDPFFEEEAPPPERPPADTRRPTTPEPRRPAPPPTPSTPVDDEEDLDFDDEGADDDLLRDEAPRVQPQAPGADTAAIYRARVAGMEGLPPDEEAMAWEDYLERYPNSLFRPVIEARMEELQAAGFRVRRAGPATSVDADVQEVVLVQPLHLPNLNPRTRALVDLEVGFGAGTLFTGGRFDFEYAILRSVSVHAGVNGTLQGWGAEAGARWAFVKSVRHKLVATLIADARVNFSGTPFFQARPALGLGKILGPVQLLASVGTEIGTRSNESPALTGGLHLAARLAPPVGLFVESDFYLRNLGRRDLQGDLSPFAFATVSAGLRIYPRIKGRDPAEDPLEVAAAGHVAAASTYLQPYLGSVHLLGAYYLAPRQR